MRLAPGGSELVERGDQRLGHEPSPETPEVAGGVGQRSAVVNAVVSGPGERPRRPCRRPPYVGPCR